MIIRFFNVRKENHVDKTDAQNNVPGWHDARTNLIVPVVLHGPKKIVETVAFLDEGYSLTSIKNLLTEALELDGSCEQLCLRWTS